MQLTHDQNKFEKQTFPLTIVCDAITSPANVGAIFRAADAFGVTNIVFCGAALPDFGKRMQKTSRSTEKYVSYEFSSSVTETLQGYKEEDYYIVALEITDASIALDTLQLPDEAKVVLIAGAERFGVSADALALADTATHISMFGSNSSMNVAQAVTIALYELTKCLSKT